MDIKEITETIEEVECGKILCNIMSSEMSNKNHCYGDPECPVMNFVDRLHTAFEKKTAEVKK